MGVHGEFEICPAVLCEQDKLGYNRYNNISPTFHKAVGILASTDHRELETTSLEKLLPLQVGVS